MVGRGGATAPLATPLNPPLCTIYNQALKIAVTSKFKTNWVYKP